MIYLQLLFTSLLLTIGAVQTAEDRPVIELETPNILVKGDLKDGAIMPLDWAQSSSVACFPGTRFKEFQGNHVLYRVEMPASSNMNITVSPNDKKHRINVYALRMGIDNLSTPPEVNRAISCEAGYPMYVGEPNWKKASKPQSVEYMSIRSSYSILIGVAGAKNVLEGGYELKIETQSH